MEKLQGGADAHVGRAARAAWASLLPASAPESLTSPQPVVFQAHLLRFSGGRGSKKRVSEVKLFSELYQ